MNLILDQSFVPQQTIKRVSDDCRKKKTELYISLWEQNKKIIVYFKLWEFTITPIVTDSRKNEHHFVLINGYNSTTFKLQAHRDDGNGRVRIVFSPGAYARLRATNPIKFRKEKLILVLISYIFWVFFKILAILVFSSWLVALNICF